MVAAQGTPDGPSVPQRSALYSSGLTSGAKGLGPGRAPGSSTCNLRSAAFSIRPAATLGPLVALAKLRRIAA